ncbi:MAG: tetratricopeptide repeat-containing diguanylate cyclase [Egibacteraceae bacterium]
MTDGPLEQAWRRRFADPAGSRRLAERLRDEAAAAGDELALGRAQTVIGACHLVANDHVAALGALLEALARLDGAPTIDRARALSEAGHAEFATGVHDEAVALLRQALRLFEEVGDEAGQAGALRRIGVALYSHGDIEDAGRAHERSLALSERVGEPLSLAGTRNNLAKVRTAQGRYDEALALLGTARQGFEAAAEPRGLGMVEHNVAVVHEQRGDLDAAMGHLQAAVALFDEAGHTHGACEARTRLGRALAERGASAEAEAHLRRAHADAERLAIDAERAHAAEALADLLEAEGRVGEALAWLRHVREIERGMFDASSESRLRAQQVRFRVERLEHDNRTDVLTGLWNRRGLEHAIAERSASRRQGDGDTAVVLVDLDDFKEVNDRASHAVGDAVLRRVAEVLRAEVRSSDLCARYGGDEFVVVLDDCGQARAERIAGGLREALAAQDWRGLGAPGAVTASLGVAALAPGGNLPEALALADGHMYHVKRAGKDGVRATR